MKYDICPICKKDCGMIRVHIIRNHNLSWEDFCTKYDWPAYKRSFDSTNYKESYNKNSFKCEICGQRCKYLKRHVKLKHNIKWDTYCEKYNHELSHTIFSNIKIISNNNITNMQLELKKIIEKMLLLGNINYDDKNNWICAFCGKQTVSMKRHVEWKHKIIWEDYCKEHKWDKTKKQLFSKEHNVKLSKNKLNFYQSERSKILKEKHTKDWTGDKNPGCKLENKIKASIQRTFDAQTKTGSFSKTSTEKRSITMTNNFKKKFHNRSNYGYRMSFYYNDKLYNCRSLEEFKIIYTLLINNKKFDYEAHSLPYIRQEDNYNLNSIMDLYYNGILFEIKGNTPLQISNLYTNNKYKQLIENATKINMILVIVNYDMFIDLTKLDKIDNWHSIIYNLLLENDNNKLYYQNLKNKNGHFLG